MEWQAKKLHTGLSKGTYYRDSAKGFPVMLIHGFPVDSTLWNYQAERLKDHFRILLPDLPGSGHSALISPTTIESLAETINDILVQEQIGQCILIGHSMGGYIALAFGEKYPQKLKGLGLYHSTAFPDTEEKKQGRLRSIEMMKQYGAGNFLRQMMPGLFAEKYRRNNKEALQTLIKSKKDADINALAAYYLAMMKRPERTNVLKQMKVPVLFVIGKEDTSAPAVDVLQQVSLPLTSEVHLLDNVAHMSMIETPDASALILEQFIRFCIDYPFT